MTPNEAQRAWGRGSNLPPRRIRAKITPAQRDEIVARKADGEDPRELALEFGVSAAYIREMF